MQIARGQVNESEKKIPLPAQNARGWDESSKTDPHVQKAGGQ